MGSQTSAEQGKKYDPFYRAATIENEEQMRSLADDSQQRLTRTVLSLRKRHRRRRDNANLASSAQSAANDVSGSAEMGLLAQHQHETTLSGQLFDMRPPKITAEQSAIEKDFTASYLDACYRALAGEDTAKAFGPNDIFQLTVSSWDSSNYQESQAALEGVVSSFYYDNLQVVTAVVDWEDNLRADTTSESNERDMASSRNRPPPFSPDLKDSTFSFSTTSSGECNVLSDAMLHYTVTYGRVVVRQGFFFFFWNSSLGDKVGSLECRSSRWVQEANVSHVHVPLHYHYRYKGRGVTVISLAPIGETLTSVSEQNGEVAAMAQQLASAFSLTPYCGSVDQETAADRPRMMGNPNYEMSPDYNFLPRDVYVHFGRDGRYYFIQNRRWFPQWLSGRLAVNGQSVTLSEFSLLNPKLLSSKGVHLCCRSFAQDAFISENIEALNFMKHEIDRGMLDLLSRVREAPLERVQRDKKRRAAQQKLQNDLDYSRSHCECTFTSTTVALDNANAEESDLAMSNNPFASSGAAPPPPPPSLAPHQSQMAQSMAHSTTSSSALDLLQETITSFDEDEDREGTSMDANKENVNLYYTGNIVRQFDRMGYPKSLLGALYLTLIQFPSPPRHMLFELKREIFYRGIKEYILCRAYETRFPDLHSRTALVDLDDQDDGAYVDDDGAPIFGLVDQYGVDEESDSPDEDYPPDDYSSDSSSDNLFPAHPKPPQRPGLMSKLNVFATSVRRVAKLFVGRPHLVTTNAAAVPSAQRRTKRRTSRSNSSTTRSVSIEEATVANPLAPDIDSLKLKKEAAEAEKNSHLYANLHFADLAERTLVAFMQYDGAELPQQMYCRGNLDEKEVWDEGVSLCDLYNYTVLPFVYRKFHIPYSAAPDLKVPLCEADKIIVYNRVCASLGITITDGCVSNCVPTVKDFTPHKRRHEVAAPAKVGSTITTECYIYEVPRWIRQRTVQLLRMLMRRDATHREWDLYGAALIPFLTIQSDWCRSDEAAASTYGQQQQQQQQQQHMLPPLSKMLPTLIRQVTNMSTAPVLLWHLLEQDSMSVNDEDCRHLSRNYRAALTSSTVGGSLLNGVEMAAAQRREQISTLADRCTLIQVLRRQIRLMCDMEGIPTLPVTNALEECARAFHVATAPSLNGDATYSLPSEAFLNKLMTCLNEVVRQADLVLHQLGSPFGLQYHRFTAELLYLRRNYPIEVYRSLPTSESEMQDEEAILQHMLSNLQTFCSQDLYAAQDALHRGVQLFNRSIEKCPLKEEAVLRSKVEPVMEVELLLRNAAELFIGIEGLHSPHTVRTLVNLALYFYGTNQQESWRECVWRLRLIYTDDAPEDIRALLQSTQIPGTNSFSSSWFRGGGSPSSMKGSSRFFGPSALPLIVFEYAE